MIREILRYPDKRLTVVSKEVNVKIPSRIELYMNLLATLQYCGGLGLAAPQIGVAERVILYKNYAQELITLINPKIVSSKGKTTSRGEGCLSVPGFRANVKRAKVIKVVAYNEYGVKIKIKANGMEAIVLQHEIDHLDGVLFIDRVENTLRKLNYMEASHG